MRRSTVFLTTGAAVLFAASAVSRFAVLPDLDEVPAHTTIVTHLAGTASLLNASALASGDATHAFLTGQPVTGTEVIKVVSTAGRTAVISAATTIDGPGGTTLVNETHTFAVGRATLESEPAPHGTVVEAHTGLVVGYPVHPAKTTYQFWDIATQITTPAKYVRSGTEGGRAAYLYTVHAAGPVKDPETLSALPQALPKAALAALAAGLPAAQGQALTAALPHMPAELPLTYTVTTDTQDWVDSATGYLLSVDPHETIVASLATPEGPLPLGAVLDLALETTGDSVAALSHQAAHIDTGLTMVGTIVPLTLVGVGLALVILAVVLNRRRQSVTPRPELRDIPAGTVS